MYKSQVDGYSVFDGIKKAPDGNYGFVIVNRGGNFGARIYNLISFIDKGFYLSKVSADVRNNIDGVIYSDVHCEIKPDLPFNRISADNVAQVLLPVEDKRFLQQCSENIGSYFKFSELESLTKSGSITWTVKSIGYFINANGINKDNVTAYNNIAYYIFSSNPNDFVTYYILEKIIFSFPDRAVAYLNIADYLAANSKCDEAGLSYSKYISLMKSGGKEKKIPKRVLNYQTTNVCR